MNILSLENVSKRFIEEKILLENTDLYLQERDKIGIVGLNGTGKSTLLKIIAGLEEPDDGRYIKSGNIVISYLAQNPVFDSTANVLEGALKDVSRDENFALKEAKAKSMLLKFGMEDFDKSISLLSGGQKKKVALVATLISESDIIVLDEPTNHLDIAMNEYLEEFLKSYKKSFVMVTHDRYLIEKTCNAIVELDRAKLYRYDTDYCGYLSLKEQRIEDIIASDRKRRSILRTELDWMKRGARARSTKQKARIERFEEMSAIKDYKPDEKLQLGSVASRLGRSLIELDGVSKAFDNNLLIKDFSYTFLKDDRVAFVGENGSGKTTLLRMIAGLIKPDEGEIRLGSTVKIGYFAQELPLVKEDTIAYMDPSLRVIDYIRQTAEFIQTEDGSISASQMLERFLFDKNAQYTKIEKLSGGEKRRLNLLRVLMEAPNVLILDEPSNDLDITTLGILEDFLDEFKGIVITVSHDRFFLDRTVNRIFAFEKEANIKQYEGNYSDYLLKKIDDEVKVTDRAKSDTPQDKQSKPIREKKLKFSFNEQREYETIEADIEKLELKLSKLEEEIANSATDFIKLAELTKEQQEVEKELDYKMQRWEYLEDLYHKINET